MSLFVKKFVKFMRRSFHPSSPYNNFNKNDKSVSDMKCFNCELPGHFAVECNRPKKDDRYKREAKSDDRYKKEERYKRNEETDERAVERSKERSKDRRMRIRSDKRSSHKNDHKVLMAEKSTKSWADTDSESSSSSSSSSDSEQEEVHCLMADQTSDDEVFDFSNIEFTREDLVQALNNMVHEYKTLSHTFEEIKAENASLKNSSAESSYDELEDTDSLKTELSKLRIENELLRSESSELKAEVEKLTEEMSSWTQSARAFHKLQEIQKNSSQSSHEGKDGISYQRPENPKPSWLKNRLDKDKAKAGSKSYVQHQPWRNSRKAKSGWRKTQSRRDLYGQHMKSKLNRSHCNYAQTLKDTYTGKTVKAVTVKAGSFDAVTTERFQMMTVIHFGLKVNWGKVLFNVLKDMVDKSQRKAKGFAAQIGVLLKGIPAIALGEGVPFPLAKILYMKTVNTYIATNTTIDAREEQGMVSEAIVKRKSKSTKKSSSADDTPVKVISEIAGSKKRVATEDNAPAIPKKRRTVKTKLSPSQESLDIVNVTQDVVPLQIVDPTPVAAAVNSPVPKQKSRKRRLVLPTGSDDEIMGPQELVKDTDEAAFKPTDEVDITIEQVLEETLKLVLVRKSTEDRALMKRRLPMILLSGWMILLPGTVSQRLLGQGLSQKLRVATVQWLSRT
ncbi:hypothetical protein F511_37475 [Dorcoceras hygrometricum]|uniref:CCHC-type domain-containing protein n=1 Tax=Dorcoceras hygrometricum TaxID=472368 RepID=A0A2Z7DJP4_9LAMI|nr:hypothetical protein F511_37475 [Dorcoceras hygrometricum]